MQSSLMHPRQRPSSFLLSTAWPLPKLSSRMEPEGVFLSRSEQPQQQLQLNTGGFIIPHPQKVAKGGEDAFYIATNQRSFGVADGVGGWVCTSFNIMLYITFLLPRYSSSYPRDYIASPTLFLFSACSHAPQNVCVTGSCGQLVCMGVNPATEN